MHVHGIVLHNKYMGTTLENEVNEILLNYHCKNNHDSVTVTSCY